LLTQCALEAQLPPMLRCGAKTTWLRVQSLTHSSSGDRRSQRGDAPISACSGPRSGAQTIFDLLDPALGAAAHAAVEELHGLPLRGLVVVLDLVDRHLRAIERELGPGPGDLVVTGAQQDADLDGRTTGVGDDEEG